MSVLNHHVDVLLLQYFHFLLLHSSSPRHLFHNFSTTYIDHVVRDSETMLHQSRFRHELEALQQMRNRQSIPHYMKESIHFLHRAAVLCRVYNRLCHITGSHLIIY